LISFRLVQLPLIFYLSDPELLSVLLLISGRIF
jgi:hypothetical protein